MESTGSKAIKAIILSGFARFIQIGQNEEFL